MNCTSYHWTTTNRVLSYLKGTIELVLSIRSGRKILKFLAAMIVILPLICNTGRVLRGKFSFLVAYLSFGIA